MQLVMVHVMTAIYSMLTYCMLAYYSHGCLFLVLPQVKEVHVKENGSIGEDEVILEFYQEEP